MMSRKEKLFLRDLGEGLILRRADRDDSADLAAYNARIHSDEGPDKPDERLYSWTIDLMELSHPTFDVRYFTIIEDTNTGEIVSSMNLIPQTWRYAGIPFRVGRPELVGTQVEYRNRGLVRAQFDTIHNWSEAEGHMLQAITGIPYYYRQFGYEMALNWHGGRDGVTVDMPTLSDGEDEPYRIRPAIETDIPFIAELYNQGVQRYLVSCEWNAALWRYEIMDKQPKNLNRMEQKIIETQNRKPIGILAHPPILWGKTIRAVLYELVDSVSWGMVTPSVIRYLCKVGRTYAVQEGVESDFSKFGFLLGEKHPVYDVLDSTLTIRRRPYAWYIRIPDLPGFITHITSALEERLIASPYARHTGELKITFYKTGLKLTFESGQITTNTWKPEPDGHSGDAAFPELTFTQLLLGYRSLEELNYAFRDCWWKHDQAFGLLNTLFPRQVSDVFPVS